MDDRFKLLIGHPTAKGPVFIAQERDGRFCIVWDGESVGGGYGTMQLAIGDAAGGHTLGIPGINLGTLGISDNINDWVPARRLVR